MWAEIPMWGDCRKPAGLGLVRLARCRALDWLELELEYS